MNTHMILHITNWTFLQLKLLNYSMISLDLNKSHLIMKISWFPENIWWFFGLDLPYLTLEVLQLTLTGSWSPLLFHGSFGSKLCTGIWKERRTSWNHFWWDFIEELPLTNVINSKLSITKILKIKLENLLDLQEVNLITMMFIVLIMKSKLKALIISWLMNTSTYNSTWLLEL